MNGMIRVACVLSAVFLTLCFVGQGLAEPRYDVHKDLIYAGAEEFQGVLHSINGQAEKEGVAVVVIGDGTYTVAEEAIFRNRGGGLTSLDSFKPGMTVHYYALDGLLTKMWPVKGVQLEQSKSGAKEGGALPATEPAQPAGTIRQEGGVWKN